MKHPVLGNRIRLIIWWMVWLFLSLGQVLLFYFAYGSFVNISIADSLVSLIIYSGIALSLWYPFRYLNKQPSTAFSLVSNFLISGAVTVTLWTLITKTMMMLILPDQEGYHNYWSVTLPYRIGTGVFIYGLIIMTYYLFVSMSNLSEKKVREVKLENLLKETELRMLRSQINPHFLFNSLNSISSLTVTDPEKARTMVIKLSDFMRYSLSRKDEQPVPLKSELENLRLYLDIEKVRFGNKLLTEEQISEASLGVKIPVMLLQPLYENAVKHGVYESTESVRITTNGYIKNGYLIISISNNYDPEASTVKGTGTGLLNVSRRLEILYGNKASLITDKSEGVYTVSLYIPADTDYNIKQDQKKFL